MTKPIHWNELETAVLVNRHIKLYPGQLPRHKTLHEIQTALPENRRRRFFTTMSREPIVREIAKRQGLVLPAISKSMRGKGLRRWDCPYCDFWTIAKGGKTRHLKLDHPNETGIASFRNHAIIVAKKIDAMVPETLEDRIVRLVAEKIYQDIRKQQWRNKQ